jgi:ribokinase
VRTVLTPAPATKLPKDLLHFCDLCVPNQIELELLVGRKIGGLADAVSAAQELRKSGVATVIVTMGARGALVVDGDQTTHVPAMACEAVDTTGAGDAFTAAMAVELGRGDPLLDAVRRACAVAAWTVTRIGAQSAFPTLAEAEAWLQNP